MMVTATNLDSSLRAAKQEFRSFFRASRAPKLRTIREFAEEEIIIPTGPYEGRRYNTERQPWTRHWFDAIDSEQYTELALVAITQGGKSLNGFVIPSLYHLFEIGETIVCGLPSMDMAGDKWREDFLPVIERTRYRDLLPMGGKGSKGANNPVAISFRNGATLRFMSGGGDDKSRAHFTARVIVLTEVDGLDQSAETSKETSKVKQIEARARAFGDRKRIYKECTVTVEEGHIWSRYTAGTRSQLVLPCPHCKEFVLPSRENLLGHDEAADEMEARQNTHFHCPACGEAWTEQERVDANYSARLIHRGQTIDSDGVIHGEHPKTMTLGFRASAVHNMFLTTEKLAADEYNAAREPNADVAEREMMQFVWALPYKSPDLETEIVSETAVRDCATGIERGTVPATHPHLMLAVDIGKYKSHWYAMAFSPDASLHTVDIGIVEMKTNEVGIEKAIELCLDEVREFASAGWQKEGSAERVTPMQIWVDSRYRTDEVCRWMKEQNKTRSGLFFPTQGHGAGYYRSTNYSKPTKVGGNVKHIGEEFHITYDINRSVWVVHINADHWKSWLHARITTPQATNGEHLPGSFSIYSPRGNDKQLRELARHLTSEHREQAFVQGKGMVIKWVCHSSANHWLDAAALTCVAASYCGLKLPSREITAAVQQRAEQEPAITTPDGRPFLVTER